jgi:hypothetical protein
MNRHRFHWDMVVPLVVALLAGVLTLTTMASPTPRRPIGAPTAVSAAGANTYPEPRIADPSAPVEPATTF